MIDDKLNFNMMKEKKKYIWNQVIFLFVIIFMVSIITNHYYNFVFTLYTILILLLIGTLYLYLDVKLLFKINILENRISNLEYVIKNFNRRNK